MRIFRFRGAVQYTRWSCRPFAARLPITECVQATDRADASRQVGLCIHRDLEQILDQVNAINVAEVRIETQRLEEVAAEGAGVLWNPTRFPDEVRLPRHIEMSPA